MESGGTTSSNVIAENITFSFFFLDQAGKEPQDLNDHQESVGWADGS